MGQCISIDMSWYVMVSQSGTIFNTLTSFHRHLAELVIKMKPFPDRIHLCADHSDEHHE